MIRSEQNKEEALVGRSDAAHPSVAGQDRRSITLFVDVSVISRHDSRTGIQRVVRAIAGELEKHVRQDIRIIPVSGEGNDGYQVIDSSLDHLRGASTDQRLAMVPQPGDIFLGLDLAVRYMPRCERQFQKWKRDGLRIYLLIHDLLPLGNRRWFRWRARHHFRLWLKFLSRMADGAICVSEETSDELQFWLERNSPYRANKIRTCVIPLSYDIAGTYPSMGVPADAKAVIEWMAAAPTILMVGTVEPRKGYDVALKAFSRIWQGGGHVNLLVVGQPGWKTKRLQARIRKVERAGMPLRWLTNVSDEYLMLLYRRCTGLLVCSLAEGYGLPIIEAMNLGAPVLARDIPVFRRLFGDNIRYFERDDSVVLASDILNFVEGLQSGSWREGSGARAKVSATWGDVTKALLSFIERDAHCTICR